MQHFFLFLQVNSFDFGKEIIVEKVFLEMMTEAKFYSFVGAGTFEDRLNFFVQEFSGS